MINQAIERTAEQEIPALFNPIPRFTKEITVCVYNPVDMTRVSGPALHRRIDLLAYLHTAEFKEARRTGESAWLIYTKRPAILLIENVE